MTLPQTPVPSPPLVGGGTGTTLEETGSPSSTTLQDAGLSPRPVSDASAGSGGTGEGPPRSTPAEADLILDFYVFGTPKPKGSMRHVGHGRMIEQVNGTTWHDSIVWAVVAAMPSPEPFTGPLRVDVTFTVRKPASAPKRRRTWPTTRSSGDLDKQLRRLYDAMQAAGAFTDDSQIVETRAAKVFPLEGADAMQTPGAHVCLYRMGDE